MISLLSIIAIGFFLGMRHATDPDHIIAVSTIVSSQRQAGRAALIGAFWGLGHTLTIFAVGSVIILFDLVIPARVGLTMELSVGFMLIVLGVWNVVSFRQSLAAVSLSAGEEVHTHAHSHGDYIHTHSHGHAPEAHPHASDQTPLAWLDRAMAKIRVYQLVRPMIVGVIHGLAGSAAVALLVLASIPNSRWAIAYLLVFGVGTIAGMMLITTSLASGLKLAQRRSAWFAQKLAVVSGLISLLFGLFLTYRIVFAQGLLTTHPHWTPH